MTMQSILDDTATFMEHLGLSEEPFGVYYSDTKPENAYGPKKGVPISRELEESGKLDMQEVMKSFSCVIGNIWLARKKQGAAYISAEEYGCPGGVYYCSMMKPHLRFIEHYVSTGFEGTPLHGERYMANPDVMREFMLVGWTSWITRTLADRAEMAGGLSVASIQFSIGSAAAIGGFIYDGNGIEGIFLSAAGFLIFATILVWLSFLLFFKATGRHA